MIDKVREVLEEIGYTNIKDLGVEFRMRPIYRDSDNDTVLRVKKDTGFFVDFKESISGSLEDLVKITLNLKDLSEARVWMKDKTNFQVTRAHTKSKLKEPRTFPEDTLDAMVKDHSYWISRGISEDNLKLFGGGVIKTGRMKDRYVFPIRNYKSQIVGLAGRDLINNKDNKLRPKWKLVGDKSTWRYPFQLNHKYIMKSKRVIVVESIGDMLALWSSGIKITLVSFGLDLSIPCLNALLKIDPRKIFICFNNDSVGLDKESSGAGNKASSKLRKKLLKYFDHHQVAVAPPQEFNDFGEMSPDEIKSFFKGMDL